MNAEPITITQARRVLEVVDAGLCSGIGKPEPGKMCVEAAVCYGLGYDFGDNPICVNNVVRSFKISLNDSSWSSDKARALGLRRIAIAQLGSAEAAFDERVFIDTLALSVTTKLLPLILRKISELPALATHKDSLLEHAGKCETCDNLSAARAASAASDAASAASDAASAASDAARYAASAAARAASYAARAARAASYAAGYAARAARAASDAARYAARAASYAARDEILTFVAEIGVDALRKAGSPGIKLMDDMGI